MSYLRNRRVRRLALLAMALIGLATLAVPASQARPAHPRVPHVHQGTVTATRSAEHAATAAVPRVAATGDGWTSPTRTVSRTYYPGGSATPFTESNDVTVSVNKHTDLQSRERIQVSWSGARPTGGLQGNLLGAAGMNQEFPVLVMQCRGTAATVSPETCWTNSFTERAYSSYAPVAPWLDDLYNGKSGLPDNSARISGVKDGNAPAGCGTLDPDNAYHFTGFRAVGGKAFVGCDRDHMPPEAAADSIDPPNEIFGQTTTDGTGSVSFEVRTSTENESLGCSRKVACSLVVIPIAGLSCAHSGGTCNRSPYYFGGDRNDGSNPATTAVSGYLWWSASNWRNRIVVPLSFALPPDTCRLLGTGTPVPFYGSELLSQAALQWAPSFCLDKSRFNWQSNTMPDDAALALAGNGGAIAAEVAGVGTGQDGSRFAFAPTALTGFGIAFNVDDPTSGQALTSLRLDARLLAKLLTESYPGDVVGIGHPGLAGNPWSLFKDPEFLKLNPGFHPIAGGTQPLSAATLLALSTGSQVIERLTAYIASDANARAFIAGKPDPWGMRINPAYKDLPLPVSTWPLLDTWRPKNTGNKCLDAAPPVYLQNIAAPVSNMRQIAADMLFSWPRVQVIPPTPDINTGVCGVARTAVQPYGQRFMLGLVTLGDAVRYGLSVASLETTPGRYVAASTQSILAAVKDAKPSAKGQPFVLGQAEHRVADAYPGAMIVYTAALTRGLKKDEAARVAQFIDVSLNQGQRPGRGNGMLPGGYVPIIKSGPTRALYQAAMAARAAIAAQRAPATPAPPGAPGGGALPSASAVGKAPGSRKPGAITPAAAAGGVPAVQLARTSAVSSPLGGSVLPLLLTLVLLTGTAAAGTRVWVRTRGLR